MNQPQPSSRLVNWTGYLAITFLILIPVGVLAVRSGAWQQGLMVYALACLGSLLLLLLCVLLLLLPRFSQWRGAIAKRAAIALPGTVLLLSVAGSNGNLPAIHDITTDTADPPQFVTAAQQRGSDANTLDIVSETVDLQKSAYPQMQTLRSALSIDDAFTQALQVANALGWDVYYENRSTGVIEAVETTGFMSFKDDIVVRVRGDAQGSKIDLRSVSRVGVGDLGANADRINRFLFAYAQPGDA